MAAVRRLGCGKMDDARIGDPVDDLDDDETVRISANLGLRFKCAGSTPAIRLRPVEAEWW